MLQHFVINNHELGWLKNNKYRIWLGFVGLKVSMLIHLLVVI
jgi:uncharacterized membrane protein